MAIMTSGTFTRISLNGVDISDVFDNAARELLAAKLNDKFDAAMRAALAGPPALRPAAPITAPVRSCLWRRNLDGGQWRKRGHPAHRRC